MKPMRFISLILIVASAMIIGITAGTIVSMTDAHKAAATVNKQQPSQATAKQVSPAPQQTTKSTSAPVQAAATDNEVVQTAQTTDDSEVTEKDLSGAEIAEVESMLETLGYNVKGGIVPAVQKYQQDNSLNATGCIDVDTLELMVDQVRIMRVKQLTS